MWRIFIGINLKKRVHLFGSYYAGVSMLCFAPDRRNFKTRTSNSCVIERITLPHIRKGQLNFHIFLRGFPLAGLYRSQLLSVKVKYDCATIPHLICFLIFPLFLFLHKTREAESVYIVVWMSEIVSPYIQRRKVHKISWEYLSKFGQCLLCYRHV
jgi:hypothetical protein